MRRKLVLLMAAVTLTGGCGTRVQPRAEGPSAVTAATVPVTAAPAPATGPAGPITVPPAGEASPAPNPLLPRPETRTTTGPAGGAPSAPSAGARSAAPGGRSPGPSGDTPLPVPTPAGGSAPAPAAPGKPGPGSPIALGNVSTTSGPAGAEGQHLLQISQVWAKWVNSRGGLNGHPVTIVAADDGGDPARRRAAVQDLVENRKVLAFMNNWESLTGAVTVDYLNQKRIPVIGLSGGEYWAYTSPMYFPQASTGGATEDSMFAGLGEQAARTGHRKLAVFFCAEAQACQNYSDKAPGVGRYGLQLVYRAKVSLAQPDFTAECLSAANAGADVIFVAMDPNSLRRIAASCNRQGHQFIYATSLVVAQDDMKRDANLDGRLVTMANVFPYFEADTPATREFQAVLKQYGAGLGLSGMLSNGWVTGKILEKAAARMPEPPTTAALLAGLWSLDHDDLGGLTQPVTFTANQPATPVVCWFDVTLAGGTWRSPDGFARHCL